MELSLLDIIAIALTYVVFGFVGFRLSGKFKRSIRLPTWIVLILGTFLAGYILPGHNSYLISGFGFNFYVSTSLQAIGVGIVIGLAMKELKLKFDPPQPPSQ